MSDSVVQCTVDVNDGSLLGHAAELRVLRKIIVNDSRPVNENGVVLSRKIERLQVRQTLQLHRATIPVFSYVGSKIDIEIHSELKIDDGLILDTTISQEEQMAFSLRPEVTGDAKETIEPPDEFDFQANLAAVSGPTRAFIMAIFAVGAILIGGNSLVGLHDQFVPEPMVWFYDHHGSRGKGELPLQKSLMGSSLVGGGIWYVVRRQLRKYMTLHLHGLPAQICRTDRIRASAILRGRSRVPLENITIRVVACNMEKGQYKRTSGKNTRIISFAEPTRALVLFEQRIPLIPAFARVESYVKGEIEFEAMFRCLYPPQLVGKHHGLALYWEVQLIHDDFIDQELVGPVECFPWKDFSAA